MEREQALFLILGLFIVLRGGMGCLVLQQGDSVNITFNFNTEFNPSKTTLVLDHYNADNSKTTIAKCLPDKANTSHCIYYREGVQLSQPVRVTNPVVFLLTDLKKDMAGLYVSTALVSTDTSTLTYIERSCSLEVKVTSPVASRLDQTWNKGSQRNDESDKVDADPGAIAYLSFGCVFVLAPVTLVIVFHRYTRSQNSATRPDSQREDVLQSFVEGKGDPEQDDGQEQDVV